MFDPCTAKEMKEEEKEEESKKGEVEQEKGNLIPNMLASFLPP